MRNELSQAMLAAGATMAVEIHLKMLNDFPKKFGKAVRATSGDFSAVRGYSTTRFVYLPLTPAGRALADAIIRAEIDALTEFGTATGKPKKKSRCVVIFRPLSGGYDARPAWVMVQEAIDMGDAEARYDSACREYASRHPDRETTSVVPMIAAEPTPSEADRLREINKILLAALEGLLDGKAVIRGGSMADDLAGYAAFDAARAAVAKAKEAN